jgi:hypothetical protein
MSGLQNCRMILTQMLAARSDDHMTSAVSHSQMLAAVYTSREQVCPFHEIKIHILSTCRRIFECVEEDDS